VLGFAAAQDTVWKGSSFSPSIPPTGRAFLLTSLGIERFLKFYNRFKFHMHAVEVASGVLLIAIGHPAGDGPLHPHLRVFFVLESFAL